MIDTCTIDFSPALSLLHQRDAMEEASPTFCYRQEEHHKLPAFIITLPSGLRLFVDETRTLLYRIEVSFPRLIHPNNSYLLQNQCDLNRCMVIVENLLGPLLGQDAPIRESMFFTRIDLTLNLLLQGTVRDFLRVMNNVHPRHGRSKSRTSYEDEGITFGRRRGGKTISFYDKSLQMDRGTGNILRIEIRLRGKYLRDFLGPGSNRYPSTLDFNRSYAVFRNEILRFAPPSVTVSTPGCMKDFTAQCIALLHANDITFPDGRTPLQVLEGICSPQTLRSYRALLNASNLDSWNFNFAEEFPEAWPPPHLATHVPDDVERYSVGRQRPGSRPSSSSPSPMTLVPSEAGSGV